MRVTERQRRIRSFVLGRGRMTRGQRRAYDMLLPQFGIPFSGRVLDFESAFGRRAPVILEIGFGMGEATAEMAQRHPEINYLGVEVYAPGVGHLLRLIRERNLTNIRIIHHDAVEVLEQMIPERSLAGIHIFFPDPWPKRRHHKRRLIQPPFIRLAAGKLEIGGYIHVATDWPDYAQQILNVLTEESRLENVAEGFASRPPWRPLTKFERRGLAEAHRVWDIIFKRVR